MKKLLLLPIALFLIASVGFSQQIPNNDFETWGANSYGTQDPVSWSSSNYEQTVIIYTFTWNTTTPAAGYSGTNSAKLVTKSQNVSGIGDIVFPGLITLGDFTVDLLNQTADISGGIPFTDRPTSMRGYYKYTPSGSDTAFIGVGFSSATTAFDTIGSGYMEEINTVSAWTPFNIPITWTTTDAPDSMNIVIMSSTAAQNVAHVGSTLYVDSLWFDYTPVTNVKESTTRENTVEIYPNPASNQLTIDFGTVSKSVQLAVYNTLGTKVMGCSYKDIPGQVNLNTSSLQGGVYLVKIQSDQVKTVKRIVIQ